jgi:hypothetical protein
MSKTQDLLDNNLVLRLWPETANLLRMCRGAAYAAAKRGDIPTVKFGGRLRRVPTAWLRQVLNLDRPAA